MVSWEYHSCDVYGKSNVSLMEIAGECAVLEILKSFRKCFVIIVCGPGNNGGDGYVVAKKLRDLRWPVFVCVTNKFLRNSSVECELNVRMWKGQNIYIGDLDFFNYDLFVDAIFGTGLNRYLDNVYLDVINIFSNSFLHHVSLDIPSGINCDNALVMGASIKSSLTIVFNALKVGNVCLPGKYYCGENKIVDIRLSKFFSLSGSVLYENIPYIWKNFIFLYSYKDYKYTRGSLSILASNNMIGAVKLASQVSRRLGVGVVTLFCPKYVEKFYREFPYGLLIKSYSNIFDFCKLVFNKKIDVFLVGPGLVTSVVNMDFISICLNVKKSSILDAGALSSFKGNVKDFFFLLHKNCILLPHEGEFYSMFPYKLFNKFLFILKFTQITSCTILLKGSDTFIVSYNGTCVINTNSSYFLSTAGTGDILSGIIASLVSQGFNNYISCMIGSWIQNEIANRISLGLISEDIEFRISDILKDLKFLNV